MFYIIVEYIQEDNHVVDKSSTVIIISFQRLVYKVLYIKKRIYKSYKDHLRIFYPSLIDKSESIAVIRMYG